MKYSKIKSPLLLALVVVFILTTGQGCFIQVSDKDEEPVITDGGLYTSADAGLTWLQSNRVLSTSGKSSLDTFDVEDIIFDPNNHDQVYLITSSNGVYFSQDQTKSWLKIESLSNRVTEIAVDPKTECTTYAIEGNRLLKTTNCLRQFEEYFHIDPVTRKITGLAVDPQNPNLLYISNSSEILRSEDGGLSWKITSRLSGGIIDLMIREVRGEVVLYAVTQTKHIYKSTNRGLEWESLADSFKKFRKSEQITDFVFDESGSDSLVHVSAGGILRSSDGGTNWTEIDIISGRSKIYAAGVNPKDPNNIFYATKDTFYSTVDNGKNWTTMDTPIPIRVAKKIYVDTESSDIMYMPVFRIPLEEN